MTIHPSSAGPPPPLPLPGSTAGVEELPAASAGPQHHAPRSPLAQVAQLHPALRTYLAFMAFFVLLWAVTGAGHFWPVYPALGWGIGLVNSGVLRLPCGGGRQR